MKNIKWRSRLTVLLLSAMLLIGCVPFVSAQEGGFVSENLLESKVDLENSTGMYLYKQTRKYGDTTSQGIEANGVVAGLVDGDTNVSHDFYALSLTDSRWVGVRYALSEASFASHITLYAGDKNTENEEGPVYLNDYYDVYASETLEDLFFAENMVGNTVRCTGGAVELEIGRTVKYVAIVFDAGTSNQGNARPREIQLWSGDESTAPVMANHLRDTIKNGMPVLVEAKPVNIDRTNGAVTDYPSNNAKVQSVINDDNVGHTDMYTTAGYDFGIQITLLASADIRNIIIDAGIWNFDEVYDIYASDNIETLYDKASRIAEGVECRNYTGANVKVSVKAKYIAIVVTKHNGVRIRRIKVIGEKMPDDTFVTENVLSSKISEVKGVIQWSNTGTVQDYEIAADKLAKFTDGDNVHHVDLSATPTWTPPRYIGAQFTLDATYYIGAVNLYAEYPNLTGTYSVYASEELGTLYDPSNKVINGALATGNIITVAANRNVKYIAVLCESCNGNPRFKEIEAWTGDPSDTFVSENALTNHLTSAEPMVQYLSNGNALNEKVIRDDILAKFTDGDNETHSDLQNTMEWDPARYIGAQFTLDGKYFIGEIKLYASIGADYPETYSIYASDSLDTLYDAVNRVAESARTTGNVITAEINSEIQYIGFFCESCTGNPRFKEIEAWTADPNEAPKPEDTSKKVLTIGNSFAQNASTYATEIAYANGEELTFGYLMFPSCTIDMHYEAAAADRHIFRFKVTTPDNMRGTLLKDYPADQNFDQDLPETAASIKEALEYTDWDIIVFQQESASARDIGTFGNLGNLIEYVRGICPDAGLMFHEVWRWGEWGEDQFDLIKSNSETVAAQYGLEIIPSGLAFEYARDALGSDIIVNENDGHYQHANTYGMYIAGCAYVGAIFDIEVSPNTFANHPYVNDNGKVTLLTKAANDAVAYYGVVRGDVNGDGKVNTLDLAELRKVLLGASETAEAGADANADGAVDLLDLIRIKKILSSQTVA